MLRSKTLGIFIKTIVAALVILRCDLSAKAQDLTGWWLSVDQTFPALVKAGIVVRMDELLVIGPQGEVENRMVLASAILDPEYCVESGRRCSDAPLLARAKLSIDQANRTLQFTERSAGRDSIDVPDVDEHICNLSVTNAEAWRLQIAENGNLILQATVPAWGIAQAGEDGVRKPAGIDAYLKAARMTITPDDPDPKEIEIAKKAREKTEALIRERFEDIVEPTSAAERRGYSNKYYLIVLRADALTSEKAAESLKKLTDGPPLALGVTEEEIAAYTALQANRSENDRMFCRQ